MPIEIRRQSRRSKTILKKALEMFGNSLIYLTTFFAAFSVVGYFTSYYKKQNGLLKYSRWSYYGLTAGMIAVSMYLLSNIVAHNFQLTYVWEYSSRELPTNFLIATFYAGQQGSFLLWGLMLSIIGYFLLPFLKDEKYEALVMGFYSLIVLFVVTILIFKSPFEYVWETYAKDGIAYGFTPKNGRGLNPILQNYWITIHPPILFLGYSSMSIPFAFAMAGIIQGDFRNWIRQALPWTLFASGILGFGLMLGGFWAYETLGWGGFWAWDPVENSSLIPWLIAVSLVHTMLIAKKNGGLLKSNFILACASFLAVLYATFLTRSGVLGDTSVHSFVSPGPIVYKLLLVFIIVFTIISLLAFFFKINQFNKVKLEFLLTSKEFLLSFGSLILLCICFIVLFGTSWPIMAELFGMKKATVDPKWYNQINLPLAIVMLLVNSLSLLSTWKSNDYNVVFKKIMIPMIISLVLTGLMFILGMKNIVYLLFIFAFVMTLVINSEFIFKTFTKNFKASGAFISHIGIALVILGALSTGGYSESKQARLMENESADVFGYKVTHKGKEQIEKHWTDREKFKYTIELEKDGKKSYVYPIVYWSDFNQRQAPFFEPGIQTFLNQDIYISPFSVEPFYNVPPVALQKNQFVKIPLDTNFTLRLLKFDMSQAMKGPSKDGVMQIASIVRISGPNDLIIEDTLYNNMYIQLGYGDPVWYNIPKTEYEIGFIQLMPNKENLSESKAIYAFKYKGKPLEAAKEIFTFEASTKPYILLVWAGTLVCVFGFFVSMGKYSLTSYKKNVDISKLSLEEIQIAQQKMQENKDKESETDL